VRHVLAALLLGMVTGCSVGTPPADEAGAGTTARQTNVDVDTPELRAAKAAAGIEPCRPGPGTGPPPGDPLPDVTLPCLGGGPAVALPDLRGPLVVNLFAQWCEPCRDELPYYQRLHEEGADSVQVLGIDYLDTQPDGAIALAKATGVTFPLLADPDGTLRPKLRVRGLPGVVLVDADGGVVHVEYTVIRSYRQLTDLVAEHLDVTVS
jgi:thiol-disulfide isomerase/thioredoxin